jgi:hypothetical protein
MVGRPCPVVSSKRLSFCAGRCGFCHHPRTCTADIVGVLRLHRQAVSVSRPRPPTPCRCRCERKPKPKPSSHVPAGSRAVRLCSRRTNRAALRITQHIRCRHVNRTRCHATGEGCAISRRAWLMHPCRTCRRCARRRMRRYEHVVLPEHRLDFATGSLAVLLCSWRTNRAALRIVVRSRCWGINGTGDGGSSQATAATRCSPSARNARREPAPR